MIHHVSLPGRENVRNLWTSCRIRAQGNIAVISLATDLARFDRVFDGAVRFVNVSAILIKAQAQEGAKLDECMIQFLCRYRMHGQRPHAGRIRDKRVFIDLMKPGTNCRVPPFAGGGRDGAHFPLVLRVDGVEQ